MSLEQLAGIATYAVFLGILAVALVHAVRVRTRPSLDIAAFFAGIVAVQHFGHVAAALAVPAEIRAIVVFALVAILPYLLLRIADHLAPQPPLLMRVALLGSVAIIAVGILTGRSPGPLINALPVGWFVAAGAYASVAFVSRARALRGIAAKRLYAAAGGSVVVAVALTAALVAMLVPAAQPAVAGLLPWLVLTAGLAYLVAFATPPALRRLWQEPALRRFVSESALLSHETHEREVLGRLQRLAADAAGFASAYIGLATSNGRQLRYVMPDGTDFVAPADQFIAGRAFSERRALLSVDASREDPGGAELYRVFRANCVLAAPIATSARRIGVLAVCAPRPPVFAAGDLALVSLLADQIATVLERRELLRARDTEAELTAVLEQVGAGVAVLRPDGQLLHANEVAARLLGFSSPEAMAGAGPGQLTSGIRVLDDQRKPLPSMVAVGGDALDGEQVQRLIALDRDGSAPPRWAAQTARPIRDGDGSVRMAVSVLEDVTAERAAQAELATRARQQAAIAQFGQLALKGESVDGLLKAAAETLAETLRVEMAKVLELLPGGRRLRLRAGVGWRAGLVGTATVGTGGGSQAGYALRTRRPVVVRDLATEARFRAPRLLKDHKVVSGISTIIGDPDEPWGVLGAHTANRREFTQDDVHFVQSVANIIAATLARRVAEAEIGRQARRVEELRFGERTRLAREIHDGLAQDLWQAKLEHGLLAETLGDHAESRVAIERVSAALESALQATRQAVAALRAPIREGESLVDVLSSYASDSADRYGMAISYAEAGPPAQLPPRVQGEILRVVQEAVINARKHAKATRIRIQSSSRAGRLRVSVRDNGQGFEVRRQHSGFGLTGMRERAQSIGARLSVRSRRPGGTLVKLELDLAQPA